MGEAVLLVLFFTALFVGVFWYSGGFRWFRLRWRLSNYGIADYGKVVSKTVERTDTTEGRGFSQWMVKIQWPYDLSTSQVGEFTCSFNAGLFRYNRLSVGQVIPLVVDPEQSEMARPDWKAIRFGWSPDAGWSPKPPSRAARRRARSEPDTTARSDLSSAPHEEADAPAVPREEPPGFSGHWSD